MRKLLYILGQLTDLDIEWILENGERRSIPAGAAIVDRGTPVEELFFILDGRFRIIIEEDGPRELAQLGSGELVGELSFLDASPPAVTVSAVTESRVLALPCEDVRNRIESDPEFAARFYKALAIFLATKLSTAAQRLGYGGPEGDATETAVDDDELDLAVLDTLHLAGARFKRILDRFA